MNFIVSSATLLRHLQNISGVLNSSNTLPILDNFKFSIKGNKLEISATDLETTMITKLDVQSEEDGAVAVPAKLVLEVLKSLPDQPCTFKVNGENHKIEISYDNGRSEMSGFNGAEFPKLPKIENIINEKVFSEETAYQITSILQGAVERGTAKKLRSLKVPLAGKTGTTNENYDAWFIGFSSNFVIGVYVGYDNPKSLGKFETGSKAALPIFKDFVEKALYKEDFKEFQIPKNIFLTQLNYNTGLKAAAGEKNIILEALKLKDINNIENNNLSFAGQGDNVVKFRQFY